MFQDFFDGFGTYFQALNLIGRLRLGRYLVAPAVISLLVGIAIFSLAWVLGDNLGNQLLRIYPWDWGKSVADRAVDILGALLIILFGLLIYKSIVMVVMGPLLSFLSEKVEAGLTGSGGGPKMTLGQVASDAGRGLAIALRNLGREIVYTLLLLLLGLIPLFSPFTAVLIFLVQSFYAGFNNFDFYLERHHRVKGSISYARRNRALLTGNGAAFMLLLLTGVGFLVAPTLGVIAATIEGARRAGK
jgi:CysZ protein